MKRRHKKILKKAEILKNKTTDDDVFFLLDAQIKKAEKLQYFDELAKVFFLIQKEKSILMALKRNASEKHELEEILSAVKEELDHYRTKNEVAS